MRLGRYHLLTPLGAGADGVAYRAEAAGEGRRPEQVELRVLGAASADPERWQALCRRLRVAALLPHPNAVAVRELALRDAHPFVVLEWAGPDSLARQVTEGGPPSVPEVLHLAQQLASVLAAAHRLGLAHGHLCPGTVLGTPGRPRLDFTGLEVSTAAGPGPFAELDASCRAPEEVARGGSPPA